MSTDPRAAALHRLEKDRAPALLKDLFADHVRRVQAGETGMIPEADLEPVSELPSLESLASWSAQGAAALSQTVVI